MNVGAWCHGLGQQCLQGCDDLLAPFWFAGSEPSLCIRLGGPLPGFAARVDGGGGRGLR